MGFKQFWNYLIGKRTGAKKPLAVKKGITEHTGKKKLSYGVVLFILINSILGSSLFFLPGLGVKSSGPASIIAWAALFSVATFIMLYIGELVTLHPTSGGTYEFCKRAYGRFISFMAGWLIWVAGNLGMALAIVAAAEYFIPTTMANYFLLRMVFSAVWILVLNYMAFRGIDAGATMLVVFGIISVIVVTLMTLPSFIDVPGLLTGSLGSKFNSELMKPFFMHDGWGIWAYLGLSLFLICEAFFGFEALSYMANEVKERKKLGKALITATVICGIIMCIYIFSSLGTVSYHDYVTDARPFAVQAMNTMGLTGQNFVVFGMYLVIIGTAAAWPIVGSRLIRALANDGLFVKRFAVLHPKHGSPYKAIYFQTVAVGLFSWLIFRGYMKFWGDPYRTIYLIFVLLNLIVLGLVLFAVPVLRKKESSLKRLFKAPLPRLGPVVIVSFFLFLIGLWIFLEGGTARAILSLAGSFILVGVPLYFLVEMYYNPKAIKKVGGVSIYVSMLTEKIFFPIGEKRKVLKRLGNLRGKTVLEYGCSTGLLTKSLAKRVTDKGTIYAIDFILNRKEIAVKRLKKHKHVKVFHHESLKHFKAKVKVPKSDVLVSVGMLSNLQKPLQVLDHLGKKMKKGGKVVFLDYDKFFYLIPNIPWVKEKGDLLRVFKKAGFDVKVEKKKHLLWSYVLVEGKRR